MANCASSPQNFLDLLNATTDSDAVNYNKIWSRENFVDCFGSGNESTDFSSFGTETYPILGSDITVKEV